MRRVLYTAAMLLLGPPSAHAAHWVFEPATFGVDRLDARAARGLETNLMPRIGAGVAVEVRPGVQLAVVTGLGAGRADFGLLAGPSARRTQADAALEVRCRWPRSGAWCVQGAVGAGRMQLAYHPGSVVLATTGGAIAVDLPPVGTWTEHVAAEVLHSFGSAAMGVRCAWRFYALELASPAGVRRESLSDVQTAVVLRVARF